MENISKYAIIISNMSLHIENGPGNDGLQNIRTVADVYNNCNLGCHYCHPNIGGWGGESLPANQIGEMFITSEV